MANIDDNFSTYGCLEVIQYGIQSGIIDGTSIEKYSNINGLTELMTRYRNEISLAQTNLNILHDYIIQPNSNAVYDYNPLDMSRRINTMLSEHISDHIKTVSNNNIPLQEDGYDDDDGA